MLRSLRLMTSVFGAALLAVAASWHGNALAAQAPAFTIEQVMSAPFPSSLAAAPAHGRFAWVFNDRGSRNVWVTESDQKGGYQSRAITSYAGDDGFDLGEVSWDAKGETVLYVRGGSLEGGGPGNVLSNPAGAPPQEIWGPPPGAARAARTHDARVTR